MAKFYRVCNTETKQGLWYDFTGKFTGLIHDKFNFCENSKLEMDFDEELVGWLSATPDFDSLLVWFSIEDIKILQQFGWCIHVYETNDFKFYDRFQHMVIKQSTVKFIEKIIL